MLGTDMMEALKSHHEVIGADIDTLDITNLEAVLIYMEQTKPQLIINCAGYTDVDGCETNADLAYQVNALGPKNLALGCEKHNAALVHFSTDYVFDGTKETPYLEDDQPNPLNVYGESKLKGERYIQSLMTRFYIVRTQWLFGKNGKNFIDTMLSLGRKQKEITVVSDQFGCPTYAKDLSEAVGKLIETPEYGTYHLTNTGVTSWYELAGEVFRQAKISGISVKPCSSEDYPTPAKRPAYAVLENHRLLLKENDTLRHYKEALSDYIQNHSKI